MSLELKISKKKETFDQYFWRKKTEKLLKMFFRAGSGSGWIWLWTDPGYA